MASFASRGRNIICIGRNYVDHAKELGNAVPKEPFYFFKPTSSYLSKEAGVGAAQGIEIPKNVEVHHEVELGVIIGKPGRDIHESEAMNHIAGYSLCIDVTGRNIQQKVKSKGLPWTTAKGFDTWAPVGPFIPKDKVADVTKVGLWLKVNDELKQHGVTSDMIFGVPKLIAHVSSIMSLNENDLIMTGTPAGVSQMKAGDKVTAGLTYPGEEGEELSRIEWDCIPRQGGYEFKE